MAEHEFKNLLRRKRATSYYHFLLDYENYMKARKLAMNQKTLFVLNDTKLAFTPKQLEVLKLVAKGFSNLKIAKMLVLKESTVKIIIYRIMKYLEEVLYEKIDRFYLIIVAQQLRIEEYQNGACH